MYNLQNLARLFVLSFVVCFAFSVQAQQIFFEDQFNGSVLDTNQWSFYGPKYDIANNDTGGDNNVGVVTGATTDGAGGTNFRFKPTIESEGETRFVRLRMNTYHPDPFYTGRTMIGTEMYSRFGFGPPGKPIDTNDPNNKITAVRSSPEDIATGFVFETRLRYPDTSTYYQRGGVAAFWTYWNHGSSGVVSDSSYAAHEIDHEMFYRQSPTDHVLNMQNYRNFNASGINPYNDANLTRKIQIAIPDWTQWHWVKIV